MFRLTLLDTTPRPFVHEAPADVKEECLPPATELPVAEGGSAVPGVFTLLPTFIAIVAVAIGAAYQLFCLDLFPR